MGIREIPDKVTVEGFFTGLIESPSDKTYTIDPALKHAVTITSFFAKTSSGTCNVAVNQGGSIVAIIAASSSSGAYSSAFANASAAAANAVTLTVSSNSSAADLQFRIGYEYEVDLDE